MRRGKLVGMGGTSYHFDSEALEDHSHNQGNEGTVPCIQEGRMGA